jgi:hypothetical protein
MGLSRYSVSAIVVIVGTIWYVQALAADDGMAVNRAQYANRPLLPSSPSGLFLSIPQIALDGTRPHHDRTLQLGNREAL